jgi:hypothetical protein
MRGYEYILAKQIAWADRRGIALIGSKGDRGRRAYTPSLDENLFVPLVESVRQSFEDGDGNELGTSGAPGKMQAVHSSSALGVNVFQYWKAASDSAAIAAACRLVRPRSTAPIDLEFETKFPIHDDFAFSPNIDIVIRNRDEERIRALAVECKFSEAYGQRAHGGLKVAYLERDEIWAGLPALRGLGAAISPDDREFEVLHAAQLIKHILGLNRAFGPRRFRLLYLWYDVLGPEGAMHRAEVESFAAVARADGVLFHSLTYQELICNMASTLGPEHSIYVDYLMQRYV